MSLLGILNVNKPAGRSSRRVVDQLVRLVRTEKVGHAGTLDPLATGVLVVCVGQATRLIPYVQQMAKQYRATFLLGRRSDTDDIEGDVTEVAGAVAPLRADIEAALPRFLGEIEQVPPAHSAVKVGGRRAYKLARAGQMLELAPRTVTIHELSICRYEYPELVLDIHCGSGTYVRALGRDLSSTLNSSAVMSALTRTSIGEFHIVDALALDELTTSSVSINLRPALAAVANLRQIRLVETQLVELRHGRSVYVDCLSKSMGMDYGVEYAAINPAGELAAIVREKRPGELWPIMNLM
jgi:tRNA pseudouridine55 synthase